MHPSRLGAVAVVAVATLMTSSPASARSPRVSQIPNGTVFACQTCHTAATGGPRNAFGLQVESTLAPPVETAIVDWSAVFDLDADGDGRTNGAELGDPDGDGVPDPEADVTSPADADDPPNVAVDTGPMDTGMDDEGGCNTGVAPMSAGLLLGLGLAVRRRRRH